jgi:hypothetical protein
VYKINVNHIDTMGGWKSFHNSGILSSIRYRQLLEEKGLNGEPVQVSLVDNSIKMKKNNEFVYFLCRFCGHQQKIDVGVSKIDILLVGKAEDTIGCNSFIKKYPT